MANGKHTLAIHGGQTHDGQINGRGYTLYQRGDVAWKVRESAVICGCCKGSLKSARHLVHQKDFRWGEVGDTRCL